MSLDVNVAHVCPSCGQPKPLTDAERHSLMIRRREARLRTKVLAGRIGIAIPTLWSWEVGIRTPSSAHLDAWRRAVP